MAANPTKVEGKVKGAGADKEFREVRVRKKGPLRVQEGWGG